MTVHDRLQTIAAICLVAVTASAATAVATVRTLAVTNAAPSTGSEGALTFNNTSPNGATIEGTVSTSGDTTIKLPFAVIGEYLASNSTFGIGTAGVSTTGYGVAAEALGANPALYAIGTGRGGGAQIVASGSNSGYGLQVSSTSDPAASFTTTSAYPAVEAYGSTTYAVYATSAKGDAGVFSSNTSESAAYLGQADGTGLEAVGNNGYPNPALLVRQNDSGADSLDAYNSSGTLVFALKDYTGSSYRNGSDAQIYGNLYTYGTIYACTENNGVSSCNTVGTDSVTRSRGGTDLHTYPAHQSEPTVEDFGEAHLAAGASYVRLDPAFANTISTSSNYLVFLTPSGDSRGLFVTKRTATGFEVHENGSGRSTLDFSYRIVAKPLGSQAARFQTLATVRAPQQSAQTRAAMRAKFAREDASRAHPFERKSIAIRHLVTR